ncbi:hypothetical protein Tco_0790085 [Tanacetum coccineum]
MSSTTWAVFLRSPHFGRRRNVRVVSGFPCPQSIRFSVCRLTFCLWAMAWLVKIDWIEGLANNISFTFSSPVSILIDSLSSSAKALAGVSDGRFPAFHCKLQVCGRTLVSSANQKLVDPAAVCRDRTPAIRRRQLKQEEQKYANPTRGEPKACADRKKANQSKCETGWRGKGKMTNAKGEVVVHFLWDRQKNMSKLEGAGRLIHPFCCGIEVAGLDRLHQGNCFGLKYWNTVRPRPWPRSGDTTELIEEKESLATKHSRPQKRRPKNRQTYVEEGVKKSLPIQYQHGAPSGGRVVFGKKAVENEEFQPLLPLGRVSLLSELAGREDQLINMNLESGWLIAASLYWRLSGRGGACYRNLFPGVNLVRSILREKKDGNEWEDWSSLFISRKELVSTSLIRRTNKKRLTV